MQSFRWIVCFALPLCLAALSAACDDSVDTAGGSGGGGGGTTTSTTSTTGTAGGGGGSNGLMPGECRVDADCADPYGVYCSFPGAPFCGGAGCLKDPCAADADCQVQGGLFVCEVDSCCGDLRCVPGCSLDTECGEGQSCNPDHRCVARACDMQACPLDFDCVGNALQVCNRRACTDDAVCDGYCVLGSCYAGPGQCDYPAP